MNAVQVEQKSYEMPPREGISIAQFLTVADIERSARYYEKVFGARILSLGDGNAPAYLQLANIWMILNVGGGPTPDKPTVTLSVPDPNHINSFMNFRVADIQACYELWKSRGAEFITEPIPKYGEIRCYIRDPDGYIIEVGQSTELKYVDVRLGEVCEEKGAIKVHTVLDNRSILPQYAVITEGKTADVKVARLLKFEPGAIVVMDRGYEDHDWWRKLTADGVFFVSRLKDSTSYGIVEQLPLPADAAFLSDEVILLANDKNKEDAMRLRRIEVWLEDKKETIVFVTNQLKLAASTIAAIYRDRWQIELFFKAIKQSLRIKTFIGTSENAVRMQIWTALIAMVVLRYLQLRSTWKWSLSNLVALLRYQLFVYRDLWSWINQPFRPPVDLDDGQMFLALNP